MLNHSSFAMTGFVAGCLLAACGSGAGETGPVDSPDSLRLYGVDWEDEVQPSLSSQAVVVEAYLNGQQRASRVVLIAGMAPPSRWEAFEPPAPPDGAPSPAQWEPPGAGTCRSLYDGGYEIGSSACATVRSMEPLAVELQFFLDLTAVQDELKMGDVAEIVVKDEADGRVLLQRTDVIDAAAPYYEIFD